MKKVRKFLIYNIKTIVAFILEAKIFEGIGTVVTKKIKNNK